jgi:hypothetical protein
MSGVEPYSPSPRPMAAKTENEIMLTGAIRLPQKARFMESIWEGIAFLGAVGFMLMSNPHCNRGCKTVYGCLASHAMDDWMRYFRN